MAHEGQFIWDSDYSIPDYTHWDPGEPNNSGDCADINGLHGFKWDDTPCQVTNYHALCQKTA